MNVAPLFSVLYIVGHYLLLYGRTNNVVKRRAALGFAACQSKKVLPAWFASVDADIRIGRRRHPHRSTQTSASVGADVLIGGYGIPAIPTQPPPRHPHAVILLVDCVEGVSKVVNGTPRRGRST